MIRQLTLLGVLAGLSLGFVAAPAPAQGPPCDAPANAIVAENCLPGSPPSEWDIPGAGDPSIQGFATDISVDQGRRVALQGRHGRDATTASTSTASATTAATAPAGSTTVQPSAALPQNQPACARTPRPASSTAATGPSRRPGAFPPTRRRASTSPTLVREDGPPARATSSSSCATTTAARPPLPDLRHHLAGLQPVRRQQPLHRRVARLARRAYKVSYNRPFTTRDHATGGLALQRRVPDGPLARAQRLRRQLHHRRRHRPPRRASSASTARSSRSATTSTGRADQRANVEAARDAGVNLAFFSGNEVFWKTRWEDDHRTLVSYKETHANAKIDPLPGVWTGTWRDPRFSPPADGGRAGERAHRDDLHGQLRARGHAGAGGRRQDALLAQDDASPRSRRARPPRSADDTRRLRVGRGPRQRRAPARPRPPLDDGGQRRSSGFRTSARPTGRATATHRLTLYRARPSGALVFGAGHRPVVVGSRRDARPRRRARGRAHAAGDGEPASPTWACSRPRCRRA